MSCCRLAVLLLVPAIQQSAQCHNVGRVDVYWPNGVRSWSVLVKHIWAKTIRWDISIRFEMSCSRCTWGTKSPESLVGGFCDEHISIRMQFDGVFISPYPFPSVGFVTVLVTILDVFPTVWTSPASFVDVPRVDTVN